MELVFPIVFSFVLFSLPVFNFCDAISWHDQQRVGQVFLVCWVFIWQVWRGRKWGVDPVTLFLLCGVLGLAMLSSFLANQPKWALVEVSLFIGCFFISCAVRDWCFLYNDKFGCWIVFLASFTVFGILLNFFAAYLAAVVSHGAINSMLLFDGFSWPRFMGQFQSLSLSLLILPVLRRSRHAPWFVLLCALWWFATVAAGTRASWMGMAVAAVIVPLLFKAGWRYSLLQMVCAVVGVVLYFLLMDFFPSWLGLPTKNLAGDRLITSLSGREFLWADAFRMTVERPFLGYGPMHFAELAHRYGAHPHQAVLQWTSEWGIPSFLIVCILLIRGFVAFLKSSDAAGKDTSLRICLAASFVASAAHAMVDGSLVMPYTQLWLSVLIGWAWGMSGGGLSVSGSGLRSFLGGGIIAFSALLLVNVVARDLSKVTSVDSGGGLPWRETPRFWQKGIIKKI